MGTLGELFPKVFSNEGGSVKPHADVYRQFGEQYGWYRVFIEVACEAQIEKIEKAYQYGLLDFLTFLTYRLDKGKADEAEDKFQENLRKLSRH